MGNMKRLGPVLMRACLRTSRTHSTVPLGWQQRGFGLLGLVGLHHLLNLRLDGIQVE
jgi:hypothetical protein